MPGVIMDHGSRNGSHTNHDRDQRQNGVNGANYSDRGQEKGKGRGIEPQQNVTPTSPTIPNGLSTNGFNSNSTEPHKNGGDTVPPDLQARIDQLPPEIAHVTADFTIPLSHLLVRLAEKTHSDMITTITDLAQMPLPSSIASINGNSSHISTVDDSSLENLAKKMRLLDFATSAHESWTKALVITGWSRRADDLSKVIDLNWHLKCQKDLYVQLIDFMAENKKRFRDAQLRNPDLKTALEVLTTGKASWMPDVSVF
jgi:mediator of RNA polymerase II transcription subunit 14